MPPSFPNESAVAFVRARDFVAQHRTDYTEAVRLFQRPSLDRFNWALDYFDRYADGNETTALEIIEEDGRQCVRSFANLSVRSNQVANFLLECGVRRGDCLLLMLGNEIALKFGAKVPGPLVKVGPVHMSFNYQDYFGGTAQTGYEVLIEVSSHHEAVELAERLQSEGHPVIRRWRYVVLGSNNEDEARDLAESVQQEAPVTASVQSAPVPFAHFDRAAGWRRM